jgi:hypothetical protein
MKSPPIQHHDDIAREMTEAFIREEVYKSLEPTNSHKVETQVE